MTDEPDLDMAMTRLLAEIAGVLDEAAGLHAILPLRESNGQMHILRAMQMAREKSATVSNVVRFPGRWLTFDQESRRGRRS